MKITCPECQSQFPLSAGLLDAEAKRFGVALGACDPSLARALVSYLGLHKPAKTVLRLAKATRIVEEVAGLAASGEVHRNGVNRQASVSMWVQAIETMLDSRGKLRLPLSGHGYLMEIVFSLADQADAAAEREREADKRAGRHLDPRVADDVAGRMALQEAVGRIKADFDLGLIDKAEANQRLEALRR